MQFSQLVVAALSAPLCVAGNRKDEVVEDTTVGSFGGMHSEDEENHLSMASMLTKASVNPWTWIDPSMQATELRNPESEIDHASLEDDDDNDDDDDFAVDIGVLSTERQLSTECESYPVLNETGQLGSWDFYYPGHFPFLVNHCYSGSSQPEDCPDKYRVPLNCWNTSLITDMSNAFYYLMDCNDDISSWDTGRVTKMAWTFDYAHKFNSDISSWDTGKLTDMRATFAHASSFNADISSWETGKVTSLYQTFRYARSFNADISSWDTRKVTSLGETFHGTYSFNSGISSWNTGNVTTMAKTFSFAKGFNVDISSWDTRKVTDMYETFAFAFDFNVDISSWNTSNVLTMESMFWKAFKFNQCLGSWAAKTPSTVSTTRMFENTTCPNQSDPDPNKGPWCQGFEERCFGDCIDAEEFRFGKNDRKSCDSINDITAPTEKKLKKKIRRFCKRKAFRHEEEATTGKTIRVKDVCQESCGSRGFGPGKKCVNVSS